LIKSVCSFHTFMFNRARWFSANFDWRSCSVNIAVSLVSLHRVMSSWCFPVWLCVGGFSSGVIS